jgi:hypothetical protein
MKIRQEYWVFYLTPLYIYDNISLNSLRMRKVSEILCSKNENTNFMFSNVLFLKNLAFNGIMWKDMVKPERSQVTVL